MRWKRFILAISLPILLGACGSWEDKSSSQELSPPMASALGFAGAFGGSDLPMLNAFPSCSYLLDVGVSEENVAFGEMMDSDSGTSACNTFPASISAIEGDVEIAVEAASVALPDPNPLTSVARFAIEGRSSITGGTASAAPTWDVVVKYIFPHTGSPTGSEPIRFGATLINFSSTSPQPVVASVTVDCGVGDPTLLPLNEGAVEIPVEAASSCGESCFCAATATLAGGAAAEAGEAAQRLTVIAYNTNGLCGSNLRCLGTEPSNPFCVADFGCSDGTVGMPCDHDSQCDEASGVICAASLQCVDGSAGVACSQAGDCAVGLVCLGEICTAS